MKHKNICKIISRSEERELCTTQFIFENTPPLNGKDTIEKNNRAMLILSGEGVYTTGGQSYPLEQGVLVFTFAEERYSIKYEKELTYIYIRYYGNRAEALHDRFGISPKLFLFTKMDNLIPMWKEGIVNSSDENADLLSESILLYTFSKLSVGYAKEDTLIRQLTEYIRENLTDMSLSLDSVAKEFGYSSKYLSRFISLELKMPFTEYLKNLRMNRAILLLDQGITSIKNVSLLSGFSDPLYFSKVFKETFGVSPKQYINEEKTGFRQ